MQTDKRPGGSLTARVLTAWGDMRGSMLWLLAQRPSETALLVFLLVFGLFLLLLVLAQWLLGPTPQAATADGIAALLVTGLIVFGLLVPMGLMLAALAGHLLARALGGTGSGQASRAAMAWAALVSAPVLLLASVAGLLLGPHLPSGIAAGIRSLGVIAFVYALSHCFAAAHGFSRTWAVMAVIAGGLAVLLLGLRQLAGG